MKEIILVTGAANGIGRSISELMLKNGHKVILVDYNETDLNRLKYELADTFLSTEFYCYLCDVADSNTVNKLISELEKEFIIPTVLLNNAGYGGPFQLLADITDQEWNKVIGTNLKGIFNFSRKLLPYMKKAKRGKIINIASIQGQIGASLSSSYVASKHGVIGYTKAIAAEWGKFEITCNAICPGYVGTAMGAQDANIDNHYKKIISRTPLGKVAAPIDIAYLVEFLISDKASFINGAAITIDGGLTADIGLT